MEADVQLQAKRHHLSPELIVVTDADAKWGDGNVIARYNEKHDVLVRTDRAKGVRKAEIMKAVEAIRS